MDGFISQTQSQPTDVVDQSLNGPQRRRVDGVVFGVEVIVHDGGNEDVEHWSQAVVQQGDDCL